MGNTSSSINFQLLNQTINRYAPIPLLFFGIIGNILNILVFTQPTFRGNICVTYFLASTIFDSVVMIISLFPRILTGFSVDPSQTSAALCKLRFFITYYAGYTAAWFIGLACLERYLASSTSVYKRQLLTMKRAYLSMILVILLGFVAFGEQFYCIDINQQLFGAPQSCYQLKKNIQCQIADSLLQLFFEILAPSCMMLVFGFLTLRNIRLKRRRIIPLQIGDLSIQEDVTRILNQPIVSQHQMNASNRLNNQLVSTRITQREQKRNAQLVKMLLVQVSVFVISTLPISIYKLYSIATIYETKSVLRQSIENTIFNVSVISLFLNNTITFYLYTLCGSVFRKELLKILRLAA